MKICPKCRATFTDELNFCLDDGVVLEPIIVTNTNFDGEDTVNFNKFTNENAGRQTNSPFPQNLPRKSNTGKIVAAVGIVGLLFVGGMIYGFIQVVSNIDFPQNRSGFPSKPPITPAITPFIKPETEKPTAKLEVEILDKVKDNFGDDYLKCMITNVGDTIIVDPSITLDLYEDDVKAGNLYGRSEMKFLKPQQKVPVWINLFAGKQYTSVRYDETKTQRVSDKTAEKLFPELIYSDAKMEIESANSSYNGRIYKDKIYAVSGIVENQSFDNISPQLFIIYYDEKDEIVGITSTYPSAMKRGEKSKFKASIAKTNTFGNPTRFEIIAVNDRN